MAPLTTPSAAKTKWDGPKIPLIVNPDQRCSPAYLDAAQPMCRSPLRGKEASAGSSPNRLGASPGAAGRDAKQADLGKDLLKPHCEGVAPLTWRRAEEKSANLVGASGTKIRVKMTAPPAASSSAEAQGQSADGFGTHEGEESLLFKEVSRAGAVTATAWLDASAFQPPKSSAPEAPRPPPDFGPLLMIWGDAREWAKVGVSRLSSGEVCVVSAVRSGDRIDEACGRPMKCEGGGFWLQARVAPDEKRLRFFSSPDGAAWHPHRTAPFGDAGASKGLEAEAGAGKLRVGVGGQGAGDVDLRGFWVQE
mmetsp:Transcript_17692/g.42675  ORF Transcript_17692/g.42675 Transcript_17692/m.42675 type:complete len:307 (+) Transcript_17692:78-998(+)